MRDKLVLYCDQLLQAGRFKDYCPNGLQVEGRAAVASIVSGVTASLALIEAAAQARADVLLVHHGWFWRNEDARLVGPKFARVRCLLGAELNLIAYHLPLDAHSQLGNNAQFGARIGLKPSGRFGDDQIGMFEDRAANQRLSVRQWAKRIETALARAPVVIDANERPVRRVAWCTGAAQSWLQAAIDSGADLYITGEASEQTVHLAREAGVGFIAAGHHATERYGVQALGEHLAKKFRIAHRFVDIDNPI